MNESRYVTETAETLDGTAATAVFDPSRTYRYLLTRTWGTSGTHAVWTMLNPSKAGAFAGDPTIGRCIDFTKSWGLDGLAVVNLDALIATDPRELRKHPDPVGPLNDEFIRKAIQPWSVVVVAWGAHPMAAARAEAVLDIIADRTSGVGCLGVTADGHPIHPLARGKHYVPAGTRLRTFRSSGDPLTIEVPIA